MRTIFIPSQQEIYFGDTVITHRDMRYAHHIGKSFTNDPINPIHILTFKKSEEEIELRIPRKDDEGKHIDDLYIKYPIHRIAFKTVIGTSLASSNIVYWTFRTEKERNEIYDDLLFQSCVKLYTKEEKEKNKQTLMESYNEV